MPSQISIDATEHANLPFLEPFQPSVQEMDLCNRINNVKFGVTAVEAYTAYGKSTTLPNRISRALWVEETLAAEQPKVLVTTRSLLAVKQHYEFVEKNMLPKRTGMRTDDMEMGEEKEVLIMFATDLWLNSRLVEDGYSALKGYRVLFIDDAHCMSDETEMIISRIRQLLDFRKEANDPIHIILMSATLNKERLKEFFIDPAFQYQFIDLTPDNTARKHFITKTYSSSVAAVTKPVDVAVNKILEIFQSTRQTQANIGIIAFMGSRHDCRQCKNLLITKLPDRGHLLPMIYQIHGAETTMERQEEAVKDHRTKVILTSSMFATGLTIKHVQHVIDTGIRNPDIFNYGICQLIKQKSSLITRDEAVHRSGCVGRTTPGFYHALYTERENQQLSPFRPSGYPQNFGDLKGITLFCIAQFNGSCPFPKNQLLLQGLDREHVRNTMIKLYSMECIISRPGFEEMFVFDVTAKGQKVLKRPYGRSVDTACFLEAISLQNSKTEKSMRILMAVIIQLGRNKILSPRTSNLAFPVNNKLLTRSHPHAFPEAAKYGDIWWDLLCLCTAKVSTAERFNYGDWAEDWMCQSLFKDIGLKNLGELEKEFKLKIEGMATTFGTTPNLEAETNSILKDLLRICLDRLVLITSITQNKSGKPTVTGWNYWTREEVNINPDTCLDFNLPEWQNGTYQHVIFFNVFVKGSIDEWWINKLAWIPEALIDDLRSTVFDGGEMEDYLDTKVNDGVYRPNWEETKWNKENGF